MSREFQERWRRREIEQRLVKELQVAQENQLLANLRFHDVVTSFPTSPLPADSNLQLSQAQSERIRAYEAYKIALARWKDFAAKGIIPDDLK